MESLCHLARKTRRIDDKRRGPTCATLHVALVVFVTSKPLPSGTCFLAGLMSNHGRLAGHCLPRLRVFSARGRVWSVVSSGIIVDPFTQTRAKHTQLWVSFSDQSSQASGRHGEGTVADARSIFPTLPPCTAAQYCSFSHGLIFPTVPYTLITK